VNTGKGLLAFIAVSVYQLTKIERNVMGRLLVLLILILLALVSAAGYIFVDQSIIAGKIKIAEGIQELKIGYPELEEGRLRMEAGKKELIEGQDEYDQARKNLFLVLADRLLKGGKGFRDARKRLQDGSDRIKEGKEEYRDGKKRINEGEIELLRGRELLKQAENMRGAFAFAAAFFFILTVLLGFRWRRSLSRLV